MKKVINLIIIIVLLSGTTIQINLNAQIVLQRCDVKNLWQGSNAISIDFSDKKEGVASIRFEGSGTDWFKKKFSQTDVGIDENGWFNFWIYVSDISMMNGDGQVELTSSGGPDLDEYSWQVSSLGLTDGWNHIQLQISTASKTGSPNLDAINFFRIYQTLTGEVTARLDDLRFTDTKDPLPKDDPLHIKSPDYSTLDGKVMFGYQGWFSTPGDGSEYNRWRHWGTMQDESTIGIEILPDMEEYEADEKFTTGLTFSDGRPVRVYSAYNKKTVMRHMKWLRDYDLDGVFLQRFYASIQDPKLRAVRDTVTANVKYGCERYDRAFVNMYDLSWRDRVISMDKLIADWKHLVDDLKITESPNYLRHRGKPLLALWGFTNRDNLTVEQLEQLMDFFKNCPEEKYRATVMLGTNQDFHTKSSWEEALSKADVISPWTVGRYSNSDSHSDFINKHILPGQDWCDQRNIDFLPVIWPGFSWYNIKREGEYQKNQRPRHGGDFYWTQSTRTVSSNAKMVYIAMFDEVDEGTAMYKLTETREESPAQGFWVALDSDGYDLPSDWYLRCASLTTQVVRGSTENRLVLDTPPDGLDRFRVVAQSTKCGITPGKLTFHYPEIVADSILQFSIDGGNTYPYTTPLSSSVMESGDLGSGVYDVWMRRFDGSMLTDLGSYTIFDAVPDATIVTTKKSACGVADGEITLVVGDNPYVGPVQFSIDGGNSYDLSSVDGTWSYTVPNLMNGEYNVWVRWENESCPTEIETMSLEAVPVPITLSYSIDGGISVKAEGNVIYGCPGSSLDITAEPAEDAWNWSWYGHFNFQATGRTIRFADDLNPDMFSQYAKFYVAYKDEVNGCEMKNHEFVVRQGPECTVGASEAMASSHSLRIYPNPADEFLKIEPGEVRIQFIEILDGSGRIICSEPGFCQLDQLRIDISAYEEGLYFYRIMGSEGEYFNGTFIKN